ncbi:hypothetical protein CSOJ01_03781 [Colletotrichum sojae]|uniref:Uncharacterized protein n=1 Tax=Colletotrichum sojae TaxID=2175907 RepID=A0A8H6N0G5_9PEZI|nr:hypothetical protein CSOJ01_03781 [Colletotrichum sojae]
MAGSNQQRRGGVTPDCGPLEEKGKGTDSLLCATAGWLRQHEYRQVSFHPIRRSGGQLSCHTRLALQGQSGCWAPFGDKLVSDTCSG